MTINRHIISLIFIFFITFSLFACDEEQPIEPESLEVVQTSIEEIFFIDTFTFEDIELRLTYSDDSQTYHELEESMIVSDDLEKLNFVGTHEITVEYQDLFTTFTIIIDSEEPVLEYQLSDTHIQWRYDDETIWQDLFPVEVLKDLKAEITMHDETPVFEIDITHVRWYDETTEKWHDILSLMTLNTIVEQRMEGSDETIFHANPDYLVWHDEVNEMVWVYDLETHTLSVKAFVTVVFDPVHGDSYEKTMPPYTKALVPEDPDYEGYIFEYWAFDGEPWNFDEMYVSEDLTLDAHYDLEVYKIDYVLDDDIKKPENYPDYYTIEDETFTLENPEKPNHIFTGWSFQGQAIPIKDVTIEQGRVGGLTFKAHWFDLDILSYESEKETADDEGIIDTFYYFELYEDQTFLLIITTLYEDDIFTHKPYHGEKKHFKENLYSLYFAAEKNTKYIRYDDRGIKITDKEGSLLSINVTFDYKDQTLNLALESYGYGFYFLSSYENAFEKQSLYESLFVQNETLATLKRMFLMMRIHHLYISTLKPTI